MRSRAEVENWTMIIAQVTSALIRLGERGAMLLWLVDG